MRSFLYKNKLPVISGSDGNWYAFSPYQAKLMLIRAQNKNDIYQRIKQFEDMLLGEPRNPEYEKVQRFVFVVTSECNLHCDYCYAVDQPGKQMENNTPMKVLEKSIKPETKTIFVNFFGGEPTLCIDTISNTVNYLKKLGITTYLRINTNGIMDDSALYYLIENGFKIIISSDGIPEINSIHRKRNNIKNDSWVSKKVEESIKRLVNNGADFRIRCTITKDNLYNLEESIQYWYSLGVQYVHLEPINPQSQDKRLMNLLPSRDEFIYYFKKALDMSERVGLWITTGIYMNLLTPSNYFCTTSTGEYIVYNPDGSISSCYRVQNKNHEQSEFILAAQLEDFLSRTHVKKKRDYISVDHIEKCKDCEAKYICAGGCLMRNKIHSGSKVKVDKWSCSVKKELFRDAVLRIYNAYKMNIMPIIFGQFMFERKVLNKPSIGYASINLSKNYQNCNKNNSALKEINSSTDLEIIDLCEMLHSNEGEIHSLSKLSRSECF